MVQDLAESLGVPFQLGKEDVTVFAEMHQMSIEQAARNLRYHFFFQLAKRHGAQAVAVGHTADDQVETILMHLLRGAGLSGLKGMDYRALPSAWSSDIPLVRPLLACWRAEILDYLTENDLQPVLDLSNLDIRFHRNRLRHELIPYLQNYNPQVKEALWRTANLLREDYTILETAIKTAWQLCVVSQGAGFVAFDHQSLKRQPRGIQRHLLRHAIERLRPGLSDIDFNTIERAVEFLAFPARSRQRDLAAGLRLLVEAELIWLAAWEADLPESGWPQIAHDLQLTLNIPGEVAFSEGWKLVAQHLPAAPGALERTLANPDPFQAWISADNLAIPLQVRARRPGDRFQPLGMGGHTLKLSDFFINVKLPHRARRSWPLVASGDEIIWVPGLRLAHPARLTQKTRQVVHLQLISL